MEEKIYDCEIPSAYFISAMRINSPSSPMGSVLSAILPSWMTNLRLIKVLIPYNPKNQRSLAKVGYNAYSYPICPKDNTLDMKYIDRRHEKGYFRVQQIGLPADSHRYIPNELSPVHPEFETFHCLKKTCNYQNSFAGL